MTIRPLPSVLAERAKNELNEDPNRLKHNLQSLKDWIAKQPHLRARTGEFYCILKYELLGTVVYYNENPTRYRSTANSNRTQLYKKHTKSIIVISIL